jgi:virulence factor Mce-like protein
MNNHSIKPSRIVVMVLFSLATFGLLLFLWDSFGGPVPLKAKGYRITVPFPRAGQLTTQADVRISGVPVGKVVKLTPETEHTDAELQIDPEYVPLPSDTRAILRQKTLLGETYVELTPGTKTAKPIPEDGRLKMAQVADQVELDQVFQAFTPKTRSELSSWLQNWSVSLNGREADLSQLVGTLPAFSDEAAGVLGILDRQRAAVRHLVADGSTVFGTLADRSADIRQIVRDGTTVLQTTAAQPGQVRATVRQLPGTLRQVRGLTVDQRALFAALDPASRGLQTAAAALPATLAAMRVVSPQLGGLGTELAALNRAAPRGVPAARAVVNAVRPVLSPLRTAASRVSPLLTFLYDYRRDFVSSWADVSAASETSIKSPQTGNPLHAVRILAPIDNETVLGAPQRNGSNRHNPYGQPNRLDEYRTGLSSFSCSAAGNGNFVPVLGTQTGCRVQGAFSIDGRSADFPRLRPHFR